MTRSLCNLPKIFMACVCVATATLDLAPNDGTHNSKRKPKGPEDLEQSE